MCGRRWGHRPAPGAWRKLGHQASESDGCRRGHSAHGGSAEPGRGEEHSARAAESQGAAPRGRRGVGGLQRDAPHEGREGAVQRFGPEGARNDGARPEPRERATGGGSEAKRGPGGVGAKRRGAGAAGHSQLPG